MTLKDLIEICEEADPELGKCKRLQLSVFVATFHPMRVRRLLEVVEAAEAVIKVYTNDSNKLHDNLLEALAALNLEKA